MWWFYFVVLPFLIALAGKSVVHFVTRKREIERENAIRRKKRIAWVKEFPNTRRIKLLKTAVDGGWAVMAWADYWEWHRKTIGAYQDETWKHSKLLLPNDKVVVFGTYPAVSHMTKNGGKPHGLVSEFCRMAEEYGAQVDTAHTHIFVPFMSERFLKFKYHKQYRGHDWENILFGSQCPEDLRSLPFTWFRK